MVILYKTYLLAEMLSISQHTENGLHPKINIIKSKDFHCLYKLEIIGPWCEIYLRAFSSKTARLIAHIFYSKYKFSFFF